MRRLAAIVAVLLAVAAVTAVAATRAQSSSGSYTVRAIFDDASYAAVGENVRIAGANVGSIQSLGVNSRNRAAVTISIDNADFIPFYANATCAIRPQSLIGEEYVNCASRNQQPEAAGDDPVRARQGAALPAGDPHELADQHRHPPEHLADAGASGPRRRDQ